jgi:hypothetical protein
VPRRRAGLKLEAALDAWGLDVAGLRCLDAGVSTGGFADCLLQRGAAAVVGVDVGYGQARARAAARGGRRAGPGSAQGERDSVLEPSLRLARRLVLCHSGS